MITLLFYKCFIILESQVNLRIFLSSPTFASDIFLNKIRITFMHIKNKHAMGTYTNSVYLALIRTINFSSQLDFLIN